MSDTWYRDPVKLPPYVDGFGRRWLLNGECLDVLPEPDDTHPDLASFDLAVTVMMALADEQAAIAANPCRVYWGSHGCQFKRGHDGLCECDCCDESCGPEHRGCVAKSPYYGPDTRFYGEDVQARGLPYLND